MFFRQSITRARVLVGMVKAFTIGVSVMAGILIGRIQIVENHDANVALAAYARAEQRAEAAKSEALKTRILLDKAERHVIRLWRELEPLLVDMTDEDSVLARHQARQRIQNLRYQMDAVEATINATREASAEGERTATRQAWLKDHRW